MGQTDDEAIFTPGFWTLLLGIVLGAMFLLGSTLLVMAWVRAANYDGVGESGVHDLLIWGFWLAVISLAGLVPVSIWRVAAWRDRMSRVNPGT
jgi:membrane protein implicated in regulation of membrane protease activity